MIEVMSESQGNILGIRATGKLTDQDYKEVLIPGLESIIKEHGKARLIYYMDDNFAGWELGAMWDDAKFGIQHKNDFDKVAVVGGAKWVDWGVKLFAHLMKGEVKTFTGSQLPDAWEWIKS